MKPADTYVAGKAIADELAPGLEEALAKRYDTLVPGLSETVVNVPWGHFYAREGALDLKTRLLATVAALAVQGGQTAPQLKIIVASARQAGASREEIAEVIFHMAIYGGFPAMFNAMSTAMDVFEAEEAQAQ